MTPVRLLLVLVASASAAAPVLAGDEQDCFQGQDPELRIMGCTQVIARAPNDTTGYHNRAVAYSLAGDIEKAIADYTRVIEFAPDNASAYANRSHAYASIGDYAQAAADKTRAQELMAKAIAQPTTVTREGNFLPSETQTAKSPPDATPTRNAKPPVPPLRAVPPLKAEPPLPLLKTEPVPNTEPVLKAEPVLKTEPAPKASNRVAVEVPPAVMWSWINQLGGKQEPPLKAAPALKVEQAPKVEQVPKAEPALKVQPAPNSSVGQEAPPDTLLGWLKQINGNKEPPVKAAPAVKVEPTPKAEPTGKVQPAPNNSVGQEAPPDTLVGWLKQLNNKNAKP